MKKYTKEFLISEFWRFYTEKNRYPYANEMKAMNGYPSADAYKSKWCTWTNFLNELGILGEKNWYRCDEDILRQYYVEASQEEIMQKLMIKRKWGQIKIKASSMGLKRNVSKVKQRFSDDFLIDELLRFSKEYNRTPKVVDFEENKNFPSATIYLKRFGTWNNALQKAGLQLNIIKTHSKEMIINDVKSFYNKYKRSPYYNELSYSQTVIRQYWDNWNELLEESDVPINIKTRAKLTKSDAIEIIQKLFNENKEAPTAHEIERLGIVNRHWFVRNFGSFQNALLEAGVIKEIIDKDKWVENSIDGLKFLFNELKRPPNAIEYDHYARENNLLNRKALEHNFNMRYTDICLKFLGSANQYQKNRDEMYEELLLLKTKLGRTPYSNELREHGINFRQCYRIFNMTYNEMIQSFGWELSGNIVHMKTDEELLEDYNNLYKKLNKVPMMVEINNEEDMASYETYKKRFGGFKEICKLLNIDYSKHVKDFSLGLGFTTVDDNGDICRSYPEMVITNILINNNIEYIKEYQYKNVFKNNNDRRVMDWYLTPLNIVVEYFGLYKESQINTNTRVGKYSKKVKKKLEDCKKNDVKIIALYPEDLDDSCKGLINKFTNHNINININ